MTIKKIVIVGGGTAGWIAANHLGKKFSNSEQVSVTLIESPEIPPIGVGEGTVPEIRKTLAHFGISETDFIRECDVTFKQSIKFVNWSKKRKRRTV
jgi:tryptophan halogenase